MSDPVTPSSTVVAAPDHVSSGLAGEEIILDLEGDTYYGLNEVGAEVWRLVSSPRSVAGVCTELERAYDVERDVLERDVVALLTEMKEHGLIRVVSS